MSKEVKRENPMERAVRHSPTAFFQAALGRPVVVKVSADLMYHGILAVVDGYLNIVLEQAEEYLGSQLVTRYGEVFIRGNNGLFLFMNVLSPTFLFYCCFYLFYSEQSSTYLLKSQRRVNK